MTDNIDKNMHLKEAVKTCAKAVDGIGSVRTATMDRLIRQIENNVLELRRAFEVSRAHEPELRALPVSEMLRLSGVDVHLEEKENEAPDKQIVPVTWHAVNDKEDYPGDEDRTYLLTLKNGAVDTDTLGYDDGWFFETYDWKDIAAWAELPVGAPHEGGKK